MRFQLCVLVVVVALACTVEAGSKKLKPKSKKAMGRDWFGPVRSKGSCDDPKMRRKATEGGLFQAGKACKSVSTSVFV